MANWSFLLGSLVVLPAVLVGQSTPPEAPPPVPSPSATTSPSSNSPTLTQSTPPPSEPYIIEDGGFSLEPIYWLNRAQPLLRGGATATATGNLDFGGQSKYGYGGIASMPLGPQNTLRLSYFRIQGNANTVLSQDASIFSEGYSAGDYLNSSYRLQSFKLSWDYLGYTWHRGDSKIRLKTLYEVQYDTTSAASFAPFKVVTTNASTGNTDYNTANGSKNLILPTFGLELEQAFAKHFRWEVKASGFGLPHRSAIWDAEGSLAARVGPLELLLGEKAYYYKTSPQSTEYFTDTLSGAYAGLRYYWGRE
jgi:hypothetical protein